MNENQFIQDQFTFNTDGYQLLTSSSNDIIMTDNAANEIYQFNDLLGKVDNIVNFRNPRKYIRYGSLTSLIQLSITNIITSFPPSLRINKSNDFGVEDINIFNINNDGNFQSFEINKSFLKNPLSFNVNSINVDDYDFVVENIAYPLSNIVEINDSLIVTIIGRAFNDVAPLNIEGYIAFSNDYYNTFLESLNSFERYLLNDIFLFDIETNEINEKNIFYSESYTWPKVDRYNLDVSSSVYEDFVNSLIRIGDLYDEKYTNIVKRKLVPQSIQDNLLNSGTNPTYGKINVLLEIIGQFFDKINENNYQSFNREIDIEYKFLSYYDKLTMLNFLKLNNINISDSTELINLYFMFVNFYFFERNKNKKELFYTILNILNIPDELIEYKEYIYTYDDLNFTYLQEVILQKYELVDLPITNDGALDLSKIDLHVKSKKYLNKIENILNEDLSGEFFVNSTRQIVSLNYGDDFNLDDTSFSVSVSDDCFIISEEIVEYIPEVILDECGCSLDIINKSLKINVTHINPYDDNCPKLLLDIVPQCQSFVFSGQTTTNCTSQLVLLSLDDTPNSVSITVNQNNLSYSYKLIVNNNCFEDQTIIRNNIGNIDVYRCYVNDTPLMSSGFVNTIRVYSSLDDLPIDVILNPYTSPYLNGPYGNLVTSDLFYQNINWQSNIYTLIQNALDDIFGATLAIDYIMDITDEGDGLFSICFLNKNEPVLPTYNIGINEDDSFMTLFDGNVFVDFNDSFLKINVDDVNDSVNTILGQLTITNFINTNDIINNLNSDYNTIQLLLNEINFNGPNSGVTFLSGITELPIEAGDLVTGAFLQYNTWGGVPPFTYYGNQPNEFLLSGETFVSFYEDANGCVSNLISGVVYCQDNPCLYEYHEERTRTVTETTTTTETFSCDDIILDWSYTNINSPQDGSPTPYELTIIFPNFMEDQVIEYQGSVVLNSDLSIATFSGNTETDTYTMFFALDNNITNNFTFEINLFVDNVCETYTYSSTFDFLPGGGNSFFERAIISKPDVLVETEVTETFTETYFELVGGSPVLTGFIQCNEDNTATAILQVSGGTPQYEYVGITDGIIYTENGIYEGYVIDSNGCISNTITLEVDCIDQLNCQPLLLQTALETISYDTNAKTARVNFNYLLSDFESIEDIDEVNVVLQGITGSENYMIGSPIILSYNGEFGAKDVNFNFNPDLISFIFIRVYITVTLTNGCVYTNIHDLSVDASILADLDTFEINL